MFNKKIILILTLLPATLFNMTSHNSHLEFCPARRAYVLNRRAQPSTACPFCDKETLKNNYILYEKNGVRIILNKFPYFDLDQGHHFVIMPTAHKTQPHELSQQELIAQADAAQNLIKDLSPDSYSNEFFTNWGKLAGQTVPHWHSQAKIYTKPPLSMLERMKQQKNPNLTNIEDAFNLVQKKLAAAQTNAVTTQSSSNSSACPTAHSPKITTGYNATQCTCCAIQNDRNNNKNNFVIARFKHNYVCLSHYPRTAGEIAVIPYDHVSTIKDLSPEAFRENMILAMTLLPMMHEYAKENIRESDGGNLYTKSLGENAPIEQQKKHHVHTLVIPRTIIQPTPGTIDGHSCKLDYNPDHLRTYLKSKKNVLIDALARKD